MAQFYPFLHSFPYILLNMYIFLLSRWWVGPIWAEAKGQYPCGVGLKAATIFGPHPQPSCRCQGRLGGRRGQAAIFGGCQPLLATTTPELVESASKYLVTIILADLMQIRNYCKYENIQALSMKEKSELRILLEQRKVQCETNVEQNSKMLKIFQDCGVCIKISPFNHSCRPNANQKLLQNSSVVCQKLCNLVLIKF